MAAVSSSAESDRRNQKPEYRFFKRRQVKSVFTMDDRAQPAIKMPSCCYGMAVELPN
jgi:hypothetical protein